MKIVTDNASNNLRRISGEEHLGIGILTTAEISSIPRSAIEMGCGMTIVCKPMSKVFLRVLLLVSIGVWQIGVEL